VYSVAAAPWRILRNVHIAAQADIGPGLRLPHPYNVLLPSEGVIGRDCSIYHDVTLGRGPGGGLPVIGDAVMIFPGARVLGSVSVGDGAQVGANCVVTRDVPTGASVTVAPPRVIPQEMAQRMRLIREAPKEVRAAAASATASAQPRTA
jgi:serine O-acetyltransferase